MKDVTTSGSILLIGGETKLEEAVRLAEEAAKLAEEAQGLVDFCKELARLKEK